VNAEEKVLLELIPKSAPLCGPPPLGPALGKLVHRAALVSSSACTNCRAWRAPRFRRLEMGARPAAH